MTVFIHKGDGPLSYRQAVDRGRDLFAAERIAYLREAGLLTSDPDYIAWANQWLADNVVNETNNVFNHAVHDYRAALARLARYRLAEGRPELVELQDTGQIDPETGEPVMADVVVQTAVDPLPAEVSGVDDVTGEPVMIPNPAIVRDDAERDEAQAVVDAAPPDVIALNGGLAV
ncbi:hypothetical protein [Sagittula salina]|uniref:Uncharacterized protein n=1 Tax=Sagittula salina TaxID=2820268 RepID=A0A940S576_9RHOB|nr:hypothetical protein [Sagittula salina]MBP0484685.1 hypothetical protein [Sagittula salina]